MGEIVNLRQARKAKARLAATETAAVRRARFGRTRAEVAADAAEAARMARVVDGAALHADADGRVPAEAVPTLPSLPPQTFLKG